MRIVLDPGHGGHDTGAYDPADPAQGDMICTVEAEHAFDIAQRAERILRTKGYSVFMTRKPNSFATLQGRCDFANKFEADIFVSVHLNAHANQKVKGIEVFSYPGSIDGARLRNAIYAEIMNRLPSWRQRGTKEANFYVLRKTKMPACLVECGFITNIEEEKMLADPEIRQTFAEGIVAGIEAYF